LILDNRVRKNEICIVNLPSCGYVFSSSPSCFIAYGFSRSALEMEILRSLLTDRRIEAYEAGGALAPAQQVFCLKICSKIIQSQFCIVLLNNDTKGRTQKPNANVHMEYGLMLGFNKYILPFQHDDYQLAFNVAGLDTIKYDNNSFKAKAAAAIDQAISQTAQTARGAVPVSPDVGSYLLLHGGIVSPVDSPGDRAIYQLGQVCGFNLLNDFTGNRYMYFGNFPALQPSVIAWRVKKIIEILDERLTGVEFRVTQGIVTAAQRGLLLGLRKSLEIWILAKDTTDRDTVIRSLADCPVTLSVFTVADVSAEVGKSGMY
jgi:Predicted nucleotide-binding protein containing TIR-like domain